MIAGASPATARSFSLCCVERRPRSRTSIGPAATARPPLRRVAAALRERLRRLRAHARARQSRRHAERRRCASSLLGEIRPAAPPRPARGRRVCYRVRPPFAWGPEAIAVRCDEPPTVLIVGASRGIGLELARATRRTRASSARCATRSRRASWRACQGARERYARGTTSRNSTQLAALGARIRRARRSTCRAQRGRQPRHVRRAARSSMRRRHFAVISSLMPAHAAGRAPGRTAAWARARAIIGAGASLVATSRRVTTACASASLYRSRVLDSRALCELVLSRARGVSAARGVTPRWRCSPATQRTDESRQRAHLGARVGAGPRGPPRRRRLDGAGAAVRPATDPLRRARGRRVRRGAYLRLACGGRGQRSCRAAVAALNAG